MRMPIRGPSDANLKQVINYSFPLIVKKALLQISVLGAWDRRLSFCGGQTVCSLSVLLRSASLGKREGSDAECAFDNARLAANIACEVESSSLPFA